MSILNYISVNTIYKIIIYILHGFALLSKNVFSYFTKKYCKKTTPKERYLM